MMAIEIDGVAVLVALRDIPPQEELCYDYNAGGTDPRWAYCDVPRCATVAPTASPAPTLVAHYSFDDGTAAEDSDGNLDGTITSATATTGRDGSGALAFDGDDAVDATPLPTVWVEPPPGAVRRALVRGGATEAGARADQLERALAMAEAAWAAEQAAQVPRDRTVFVAGWRTPPARPRRAHLPWWERGRGCLLWQVPPAAAPRAASDRARLGALAFRGLGHLHACR